MNEEEKKETEVDMAEIEERINEELKQQKKLYRKGFRRGILVTLTVCMAIVCLVTGFLKKQGFVLTTFKVDTKLTADVLSQDVQNKVSEILSVISNYYLGDFSQEEMANGMYKGLVESLGDEYSQYFTPAEYKDYLDQSNSRYEGIGAVLGQDKDTNEIYIQSVYEDSPAKKAGLRAGDVFVSADDVSATDGISVEDFAAKLRGEAGSSIDVVVRRDDEELSFTVIRKAIETPTVNYTMLEDGVGYIQVVRFSSGTADQFEVAIAQLKKQGMEKMVIDMRDNGGGLVTAATDMLDQLLPEGLLVYTENKAGQREEIKSDKKSLDMPICILVNENSASATEIFAGAMQDYKAATLIGTTTYGKGIIQIMIPLSDGGAVKVTTSKYFTPNGRSIHGVGIDPDVELSYEYSGNKDEAYDYTKDNQVEKALEILKEK